MHDIVLSEKKKGKKHIYKLLCVYGHMKMIRKKTGRKQK